MGQEENNNEVYHNLTESDNKNTTNNKWTFYLIICCLTACHASFIFGYNIGATNLPTPLIKEFYGRRYYGDDYYKLKVEQEKFEDDFLDIRGKFNKLTNDKNLKNTSNLDKLQAEVYNSVKSGRFGSQVKLEANQTIEQYIDILNGTLLKEKEKLDEVKVSLESSNTLLWTLTTSLFVVGGMIGAFTSKYVLDILGRKKGILFHYVFSISGAILTFIAPMINSPECVMISRFLYGIQGGMTCGLVPTYLAEISPGALRGATGVIHQLCLTIGILVSQVLGFRQILGTSEYWNVLLAIPIVPSLLGGIILLLLFPESPKALLINNKDEESAIQALKRLRNSHNVSEEIEQMKQESREGNSDEAISMKELFTIKELRWPLITGLILQLAQQLCGINAIFFYSEGIFRRATIQDEHIQYAVFATGLINVICTILVVPLIDRLGRKPLIVFPMLLMIVDFILLTIFLVLQKTNIIYSYLSIVCIVVFIMCFAFGLGPIPFIYVAECFRQDARSAALAICMFTNWVANLLLTLTFEYLAKYLQNYVFLVFTFIVGVAVIVIFKKVPETKGRSVEEIMAFFNGTKRPADNDESRGKLMSGNSKV